MRKYSASLIIVLTCFILAVLMLGCGAWISAGSFERGCTIATWSDNKSAFFLNNEDMSDAYSGRIWFIPADAGKHGYAMVGYRMPHYADIQIGGINDQGLVFDANGISQTDLRKGTGNTFVAGSFYVDILQTCSTVQDVADWMKGKDLPELDAQQHHWADRNGNAIVVDINPDGDLEVIPRNGVSICSVNWNLSYGQNAPKRAQDWRYDRALEVMNASTEVSAKTSADVLNATRQSRRDSWTLYSYVVDLPTGKTDFYINGNFLEKITLDMRAEIARGPHEYDLAQLFREKWGYGLDLIGLTILVLAAILAIILTIFFARRDHEPTGKEVAAVLIGSVLFALLGYFIRIPFPIIPIPDLVTVILYVSFTAALVFTVGRIFKPWKSLLISFTGLVIGEVAFCQVTGCSDNIMVRLTFVMLSFGVAAVVMALLYKKSAWMSIPLALLAMTVVPLPATFYYYTALLYSPDYIPFYIGLPLIINIVCVPVAVILIVIARAVIKPKSQDRTANPLLVAKP